MTNDDAVMGIEQLAREEHELRGAEGHHRRRPTDARFGVPDGCDGDPPASFTGFPVLLVGLVLSGLVVVKEISRLRIDPEARHDRLEMPPA